MAKIKIKRGLEASLGSIVLEDGEFAVTTDTHKLYIGIGGSPYCVGSASSSGDMLKSIYDTDNDGIVDQAEKVEWDGVLNKPVKTLSAIEPSTIHAGDSWDKIL